MADPRQELIDASPVPVREVSNSPFGMTLTDLSLEQALNHTLTREGGCGVIVANHDMRFAARRVMQLMPPNFGLAFTGVERNKREDWLFVSGNGLAYYVPEL